MVIGRSLIGLGAAAIVVGSLATFASAKRTVSVGTLVLSGGIQGTVRLNPSNCVSGPGASFAVTGVSGGGWSLLFLKASNPPGKKGAASVVLEGEGYRNAVGAVDEWGWYAKRNSGHVSGPSLRISSNGEVGEIKRLLPVASSYNGPRARPVQVTASWNAGTCKTNE
jgi:hypothetical protein